MAGKVRIRIKRGEFWLASTVISLTTIIWFITGVMYTNAFDPEGIKWLIVGCVLVAIFMVSIMLYVRLKKVDARRESEDERSDRCSLRATRNAFIVTLLALALYMIAGQIHPDWLYRIQALQGVFGVSVASYTFSYFFYRYTV